MGSAVSSVLGGGGSGGILGAVGGIVGGIFGGPIGAMIGQAVGDMLQQAIGNGLNDAVDTLVKDHGMPKFLGDEVKSTIGNVMGQQAAQSQQGVSAEAQQIAHKHFNDSIKQFEKTFSENIVRGALDELRGQGGGNSKPTKGGWLQAIASVMGKQLGNKAKEIVKLSNEINAAAEVKNDKSKTAKEQEIAASTFNQKMTEFQATSQEYGYMNSVFTTALKGLGEALSSMARKQ